MEQEFVLLKDPRVEASQEDLQAQFDFLIEVRDKLSETHQAIVDIRSTRDQLSGFMKRVKGDTDMQELVEQAKQIDSVMTDVEQELYQTKNRSGQDPLNYPIKLNNKLAHLGALVSVGDFAPTAQSYAFKREVTARIDEQLERWYELTRKDIPRFNKAVRGKQVDVISTEPKEALR